MQLRARVPVTRQVVLVPDMATLVDEVSKWSTKGHWPVLIEDDVRTPMFIRRFRPDRVLRRESVGAMPADRVSREAAIEQAAANAWGARGASASAAAAALGLPVPAGLIVSDANDPAAAAALLLSAGRGQNIAWVDLNAGHPNNVLDLDSTTALRRAVEAAASSTGRSWRALGDGIDAVTFCRRAAARVRTQLPIAGPGKSGDEVALTDVIGRLDDGSRWAFTGWIFGSAERAAYMANCSLFLPRVDAWLCDTYPDSQPWARWGLRSAAKVLESAGWDVDLRTDETLTSLHGVTMSGLRSDLVMFNSKGNADFFRMSGDVDADPGDIPVLDLPAAVSMIHSWSLRSPDDVNSVGGRWLERGAYAMVGSSAEPQLSAFVRPELFANRLTGGVPMLIAARWWKAQSPAMAAVWRINTLGDPLMIAPPPQGTVRRPVKPEMPLTAGVVDMEAEAIAAMQRAEQSPSDEAFALAIDAVTLLGRDQISAALWNAAAHQRLSGPQSARAAFGSLFRLGDREALQAAWVFLARPTERECDMFWSALSPSLGEGTSDSVLQSLVRTLTSGGAVARAEALAPIMARRFGTAAGVRVVNQAMALTETTRGRRALGSLKRRVGG